MNVPQTIAIIAAAVAMLNLLMLPWGGLLEVLEFTFLAVPSGLPKEEMGTAYVAIIPAENARTSNGASIPASASSPESAGVAVSEGSLRHDIPSIPGVAVASAASSMKGE